MLEINQIHQGDCLALMPSIPDKSIDMILCDLPYGTTACEWDSIIDMGRLWAQYERVIKDNGAIVLTANSVFTFQLWESNKKLFRYKWIWQKTSPGRFVHANKMPLASHEDILIFYKKAPCYNPQMTKGKPYKHDHPNSKLSGDSVYINDQLIRSTTENNGDYFPSDVIQFKQHNGFT